MSNELITALGFLIIFVASKYAVARICRGNNDSCECLVFTVAVDRRL